MLASSFKLDGILDFLKENKAYFKYRLSFSLFFPSSCFLFADRDFGALGKIHLPMMISALHESVLCVGELCPPHCSFPSRNGLSPAAGPGAASPG